MRAKYGKGGQGEDKGQNQGLVQDHFFFFSFFSFFLAFESNKNIFTNLFFFQFLFIFLPVFRLCGCAWAFCSCGGFTCCRAWALGCVGFSSCGSRAQQLWLAGSRAQAQQLWLMGLVAPRHVGSSRTRARTCVPCVSRQILNHCATREVPFVLF